jgi:hypothetical protein
MIVKCRAYPSVSLHVNNEKVLPDPGNALSKVSIDNLPHYHFSRKSDQEGYKRAVFYPGSSPKSRGAVRI